MAETTPRPRQNEEEEGLGFLSGLFGGKGQRGGFSFASLFGGKGQGFGASLQGLFGFFVAMLAITGLSGGDDSDDDKDDDNKAEQNQNPIVRGLSNGWNKTKEIGRDIKDATVSLGNKVGSVFSNGYNSLLDMIGKHESNGDYNRVYSRSGVKRVDLTNMTVNQVLAWQTQYVDSGSPSSAAGKYQIIRKNLLGLKDEMGLTGNEKFDVAMQDKMAMHLLRRRGLSEFEAGRMTADQMMKSLSQEWASLPKDESGVSYYHGDGLNKASATPSEVRSVLLQQKTSPSPVQTAALSPQVSSKGSNITADTGIELYTATTGRKPASSQSSSPSADPSALAFYTALTGGTPVVASPTTPAANKDRFLVPANG